MTYAILSPGVQPVHARRPTGPMDDELPIVKTTGFRESRGYERWAVVGKVRRQWFKKHHGKFNGYCCSGSVFITHRSSLVNRGLV